MKKFQFLILFCFVILFTTTSCDVLNNLLNPQNDDNVTDTGDTGDLTGDVLEKNKAHSLSINAGSGEGADGDHYFFIAGNGNHTITSTNLTSDVDMELYKWDGTQTVEEIIL